jgi:hypothetical protein
MTQAIEVQLHRFGGALPLSFSGPDRPEVHPALPASAHLGEIRCRASEPEQEAVMVDTMETFRVLKQVRVCRRGQGVHGRQEGHPYCIPSGSSPPAHTRVCMFVCVHVCVHK